MGKYIRRSNLGLHDMQNDARKSCNINNATRTYRDQYFSEYARCMSKILHGKNILDLDVVDEIIKINPELMTVALMQASTKAEQKTLLDNVLSLRKTIFDEIFKSAEPLLVASDRKLVLETENTQRKNMLTTSGMISDIKDKSPAFVTGFLQVADRLFNPINPPTTYAEKSMAALKQKKFINNIHSFLSATTTIRNNRLVDFAKIAGYSAKELADLDTSLSPQAERL